MTAHANGSTLTTRVDVAIRGVRLRADADAPVQRRAGAGPSDDGHVVLGGICSARRTALPVADDSPYTIENGRLLFDGADAGMSVEPSAGRAFYDLKTSDGVAYEQLARLHGRDVLATTVVQTCSRYDAETRCRFCAIEASLAAGSTTAVKTPAQLAEVAEAAVRLDGVRQMVMTTGTSTGRDRGARHLARCVRAIKEAVPELPIQVQCEPPAPMIWPPWRSCARRVPTPSASTSSPWTMLSGGAGCRVRRMSRCRSIGWPGTRPSASSAATRCRRICWWASARIRMSWWPGAAELIDAGVYPFVVPFRPLAGTLATDIDGCPRPPRTCWNG